MPEEKIRNLGGPVCSRPARPVGWGLGFPCWPPRRNAATATWRSRRRRSARRRTSGGGRRRGRGLARGKGASTYAGNVLQVVKQFFRVARSKGLVIVNPADTLDPDDSGSCIGSVTASSRRGDRAILEGARIAAGTTPTVRNALRLLLLTGVRSGELLQAEVARDRPGRGEARGGAQAHVDDPGRAPEADEEAEGEGSQALPRPPDADDDRRSSATCARSPTASGRPTSWPPST